MRNIKLILEYDGSNYCGWQRQKNAISVQQKLEEIIGKLIKEDIELIGCSRTDSGVHAKAYVANFFTNATIPGDKFKYAINNKLPEDIVIINSEEVSEDFHARYSCKGKTYSYTILNRENPCAINRKYLYHVKRNLDVDKMIEASKFFIGTHDFSAFKSPGSSVKTSVRTVTELNIYKSDDRIKLFISADGFLYNMVRIIVGTLLRVGTGKINPEDIEKIIYLKDRKSAGKVVPASGLCLEKVFY